MLPEEDAAAFQALEAALLAELAPEGALQTVLAQRVVSAAWRLMRADRMEAEVLDYRRFGDGGLGLALIRDGNGTRSFDTLMRYRNAATAELLRAQDPPDAPGPGQDRPAASTRPAARSAPARPTKRTQKPRQIKPLTAEPRAEPQRASARGLPGHGHRGWLRTCTPRTRPSACRC